MPEQRVEAVGSGADGGELLHGAQEQSVTGRPARPDAGGDEGNLRSGAAGDAPTRGSGRQANPGLVLRSAGVLDDTEAQPLLDVPRFLVVGASRPCSW